MVKNLPAMRETWVWSLVWEDPLEKGMATHSGICAWRIPMHREAWWTAVHGSQRVGHDEQLSTHTYIQFFRFPSHLGHHRALREFPVLYSRFSLVIYFNVVSWVLHSVTPWTTECQASLSIANSQSLLRLMSIELVMPSNHLILCRPLLLLPSIFPSIRVFSNKSALLIRWPWFKCL